MKAVKIVSAGKAEIQDVSKPEVLEDRVLVKVNAVALNPTDWQAMTILSSRTRELTAAQEAYRLPANSRLDRRLRL